MAAAPDRPRRPSMHRRIWTVTVAQQLLGVMAVGALCLYEGFESVTAAFRGQSRTLLKSMGEVLERAEDLPQTQAALDALCGGLRADGHLFYCIWRAEDATVLLDSPPGRLRLPPGRRLEIAHTSTGEGRQNLWLLGGDRQYFARWRQQEGRWGPIVILAALDISDQVGELGEFLAIVLAGSLGVLIACALLTHWLVGVFTRPLVEISGRLAVTPLHALADLELDGDAPAELAPFVEVIQGVIRRLDEHRRREKRFIADASHDLKTPAALIKASAELALSRQHDPRAWRDSLVEILGDIDRMDAMINQLLELARLDATLRLDDCCGVDLALLRRQVEGDCRDLLAGRPPLEWRLGRVRSVYGNAGMLRRLLVNLARNALCYGPRGGRVSVSAEAAGASVVLRVVDQGGGLSRRDIELMTQRFTRLDDSRRRGEGCGLGLSIVAEIVRLHQGEMTIASSPGPGTVVSVTLPVAGAVAGAAAPADKAQGSPRNQA